MPNTIAENLQRLVDAKEAIAEAITIKGGTVGANDGLEEFADDIGTIPASGQVTLANFPSDFNFVQNARNLEVDIPSGCVSIATEAFCEAHGLTRVTIPNTVTGIGESAFFNCDALTAIDIPGTIQWLPRFCFTGCNELTDVTLHSGLEELERSSLSGCGFEEIELPNTLTIIGETAFSNCYNLKSISIPASVTTIGSGAFINCTSLTTVEIPASVTSLEENTFSNDDNIETITIHKVQDSISGAPWGAANATIIWDG